MIWVWPGDLPKYDFLAGDRELVRLLATHKLPIHPARQILSEQKTKKDSSLRAG